MNERIFTNCSLMKRKMKSNLVKLEISLSRNNTGNGLVFRLSICKVPNYRTMKDMNSGFVQEQGSVALECLLTLHISQFSLQYS